MAGITSEPLVKQRHLFCLVMIVGEKINRKQKLVFNMNVHIKGTSQKVYFTSHVFKARVITMFELDQACI